MGIRSIYFRDEIDLKLQKENNRSGLINGLLEAYWKKNIEAEKTDGQIINEVKEKIREKEEELKEAEKRIEKEKKYGDLVKFLKNKTEKETEEIMLKIENGEYSDLLDYARKNIYDEN